MRLKTKKALVTGGAQGIGYAIAQTFCREGATVYLADVNKDLGTSVALKLHDNGCNASFVYLDVRDDANWKKVCEQIKEETGSLDNCNTQ